MNLDLRALSDVLLTRGQRKSTNEQCREILKKPISAITEADKDVLRQYTGAGGIESGTIESLNQHYTDYATIRAIWNAIDQCGFKYHRVLEPACGVGSFVGHRPECSWTMIDIDPVSIAIARILYPKARHYNLSFEEFIDDEYDLVISNVPFAEERGKYGLMVRPDVKYLHDFYFVHALERVRPDGLIVFITSTGTMDRLDGTIRREIAGKAEILACFRLPDGHFEKNAHTYVKTDCIFMQRRDEKFQARKFWVDFEFCEVFPGDADFPAKSMYYIKRPHMVLGEQVIGKSRIRGGNMVWNVKGPADLSRIQLPQYQPFGGRFIPAPEEAVPTIPKKQQDFREWALKKHVLYVEHSKNPEMFQQGMVIDGERVMIADGVVHYKDIVDSAKIFTEVHDAVIVDKVLRLSRLPALAYQYQATGNPAPADAAKKLIVDYSESYKHPAKDRELRKFFRECDEIPWLLEACSYISGDFDLAPVFKEKTRYKDSGVAEIEADSPLKQRAFANEDNRGMIYMSRAYCLSDKEADDLLDAGYAIYDIDANGKLVMQNEILYIAGNLYQKIEIVDRLISSAHGKKYQEQLATQRDLLVSSLPETKPLEEIAFKGSEGWLHPLVRNVVPIVRKVDPQTQKRFYTFPDEIYQRYLNNEDLVDRLRNSEGKIIEPPSAYLRRVKEAEQHVAKVRDKIRNLIATNPDVRRSVEYTFNSKFRGYVKPDYSKAQYLIQDVLDEIEAHSPIRLRRNQKEWIIQALYEGRGINAHDVGGGKTFAAIALLRCLKKRGIAHKPILPVPAKTIPKWCKDIKTLFPKALVINLGRLPSIRRQEKLFEVCNSNADFIVLSHEAFGKIDLSAVDEALYVDAIIQEHLDDPEIENRQKALLEQKIDRLRHVVETKQRNRHLTPENLGVDALLVDEAHNFKNIGVSNKLVEHKLGVPFMINEKADGDMVIKSRRSYHMRFWANWIADRNNQRNVFLLTATPTPNKPIEIYTMIRHLSPDIWKEYGIYDDRDFAATFFELGTSKNTMTGEPKRLLQAIVNAQELREILNRFVDRRTIEQMPWIQVPELNVVDYYFDMSPEVALVMEDLRRRESVLKKQPVAGDDTLVAIYTNGRAASIDPRLYNSRHAKVNIAERNGDTLKAKIPFVIHKISQFVREDPGSNHLVFLDTAGHTLVGRKLDYSLHQEIKRQLATVNLTKKQIAIINGQEITNPATGEETYTSSPDERKQMIADMFNAGKIRVLIGTTTSIGEGMDLQERTLHGWHLDWPYTPAAIRQRDGRYVRYGNRYSKVHSWRLFMRGTFDTLSFDIVSRKKGWNEAIWDKEIAPAISTEEEMAGGAMPRREQILIELEPDPNKREIMRKEFQLHQLLEDQGNILDEIRLLNWKINNSDSKASEIAEELADRRKQLSDLQPSLKIKNKKKRKERYERSKAHKEKLVLASEKKLADYEASKQEWQNKIADYNKQLEPLQRDIDHISQVLSLYEKNKMDEAERKEKANQKPQEAPA